jgi:hypothetical protein
MGLVSHHNRNSDTYSDDESKNSIVGLAGWLFADLLLALAVVFLVGGDIPSTSAMSDTELKNDVTIEFAETKDGDAVSELRKIDQTFDVYVRFSDPVENFAADDIEIEPSDEWSVRIVEDSKDADGKKTYQVRLNPENPSSTKLKLTINQRKVSNATRPNSFNSRGQLSISLTICTDIAGIAVEKKDVARFVIKGGMTKSVIQLAEWMKDPPAGGTYPDNEGSSKGYGNEQILKEILRQSTNQPQQVGFIIIFAGGKTTSEAADRAEGKVPDLRKALAKNKLINDPATDNPQTVCPAEAEVPVRAFGDSRLPIDAIKLELYFYDSGR